MIRSLMSFTLRFGIDKIPLMEKPMEEDEVKPQVVEALVTAQVREETSTPNPKEEECILVLEDNHTGPQVVSTEKAT